MLLHRRLIHAGNLGDEIAVLDDVSVGAEPRIIEVIVQAFQDQSAFESVHRARFIAALLCVVEFHVEILWLPIVDVVEDKWIEQLCPYLYGS